MTLAELPGDHAAAGAGSASAILVGTKLACRELRQGLQRFERDLTGGRWDFDPGEADYVIRKIETQFVHLQGETLTGISGEYNQVWEVSGAQGETEGYLRLLDGDGVSGDGGDARTSENELMYEKDTLKNFIDYAKQVAPAEKYDLILNDHGSGPAHGYGSDDHGDPSMMMSVLSLREALAESDVVGEGKFDFVDLDCCFNGNFEIALALSDYTNYVLGSADVDPFATVDYTALFNYLNKNPNVDTKTFGRHLVDLFADY